MGEAGLKIAVCVLSLTGHGIGVVVGRLAAELARRGHDVTLLCSLVDASPPPLPPGVRILTIGSARARDQVRPLTALLRHQRPDVLMTTHAKYADLALPSMALANARVPLVAVEHIELSREMRNWGSWKSRPIRAIAGVAYRRADAVVAVSRAVAEDVSRCLHLDRTRVEVIYNPVISPELFIRAADPCPHPWLEDGPPVVVAAGRLADQKDHASLFAAMSRVRRHADARLIVLGDGPLRSDLERLRSELDLEDAVLLPGQVANPYPWLGRARVVASSSTYEGLPTALVEALALGVPVVATDAGGTRELLDGGRFGRLVPPRRPGTLAMAILSALSDWRADDEDLRNWLRRFTVEESASRYESVLSRLAADAG